MMSDFISASIDVWNYVFAPIGLNPCPAEPGYALSFANSVDPDQLASEVANWSGSALFAFQYLNLYLQPGSSNLIC